MFTQVLTVLVLAGAALAQTFSIATPPSIQQCQPAALSWTGGTAPFNLVAIPAGQVSAAALTTIADRVNNQMTTWTVNLAQGTAITLRVTDSTGAIAYSSPITVQAGSTACVSGSASSAASSAAQTSTGAAVIPAGASSSVASGSSAQSSSASSLSMAASSMMSSVSSSMSGMASSMSASMSGSASSTSSTSRAASSTAASSAAASGAKAAFNVPYLALAAALGAAAFGGFTLLA